MESIIETGVDKLIGLVKKKGRISFSDAAKELSVNMNLIEEWADFLEDEGLINIEYKLTTPYITERKISKKDVLDKAKELLNKKDAFIRKAETMQSIIDKESIELQQITSNSAELKKSLGSDIERVKNDLDRLEKYEQLKDLLHKKIVDKEEEFKNKMFELTNQILEEQKKYENLIKSIMSEQSAIEKEKRGAESIEQREEQLLSKLREFEGIVTGLRNDIKKEYKDTVFSEQHVKNIEKFAEQIKKDIATKKTGLFKLLSEREKKEKKILAIQEEITKKINESSKSVTEAKLASKKFRDFFEKKMRVTTMMEELNKSRVELKNELAELIKRARMFSITSKSQDISKDIEEMEQKVEHIDKKKKIFENQLNKFMGLFK